MEEKGKFCPSLETVLSEIQIKSLQLSYNTCHKNISCILIIDLIIILILYLGELANPEIDNEDEEDDDHFVMESKVVEIV